MRQKLEKVICKDSSTKDKKRELKVYEAKDLEKLSATELYAPKEDGRFLGMHNATDSYMAQKGVVEANAQVARIQAQANQVGLFVPGSSTPVARLDYGHSTHNQETHLHIGNGKPIAIKDEAAEILAQILVQSKEKYFKE